MEREFTYIIDFRMFVYIIKFLMIFIMFSVSCMLILKIYWMAGEEKFKFTDKILISVPVTLYSVFADFSAFRLLPSLEALTYETAYYSFKDLLSAPIIMALLYSPVILFYILVSVFRVKRGVS